MNDGTPIVRDLVLVGGGHAHVTVLKRFAMKPLPGVRVTLVTSTLHTPYSGMLPGYISGFYTFDDVHIDLTLLARFCGARLVHAECTGLDLQGQRVLLRGRPPLRYDVLSLNLGITPTLSSVPGAAQHSTPVKPISGLVARFEALLQKAVAQDQPLRVAVVGAGASGVEVACALQYRLQKERRAAGITSSLTVSLVSRGPILQGLTPYARRAFLPLLKERGIAVYEAAGGVKEVQPAALVLGDGQTVPFDECLWTTQASAASWLAETGLPVGKDGFLLVNDCLQSDGGPPNVFAAGDVASNARNPRPKAGVFAVRTGPPLAENLQRLLTGRSLRPWTPQRTFLSLITAGDKYAVATKGWLGLKGSWLWTWKDSIDRTFMAKFGTDLDFEAMQQKRPPSSSSTAGALQHALTADELALMAAAKMRCGGCGSKVGATSLDRVLQRLRAEGLASSAQNGGVNGGSGEGREEQQKQGSSVVLGLDQPDDAAVLEPPPPGHVTVHTVDFFRAMVTDPYLFGQIAANHALSDCHAMGAQPTAALATAVVPLASAAKTEEDLYQMLAGALTVLRQAGCALVGGHSSEGSEMALGFSVYGSAPRGELLSKAGLQPGQALILTKPIGTGTLLAADMRGGCKGRWLEGAMASMVQSNGPAVRVLRACGATACTDVTGFGLLGHAAEMAKASKAVVILDPAAVPLLEGAQECAAGGYLSSLHPENARAAAVVQGGTSSLAPATLALLVDPQTAGGLLAGVPQDAAERSDGGRATTAIIEALLEAGADVNALNDEGWCALEDAYINPYPPGDAAARALWAAGGRYYMPDPKTGKWIGPDSLADIVDPALRRASSSRTLRVVRAAASAGGSGDVFKQSEKIAALMAYFRTVPDPKKAQVIVDQLIAAGMPLTLRGTWGRSLLHAAAANPHMEASAALIRALCAGGAPVDVCDSMGDQPLHIALRLDSYAAARMHAKAGEKAGYDKAWYERLIAEEAIRILVEAGESAAAVSDRKLTPLHMVYANEDPKTAVRVIDALLAEGAPVDSARCDIGGTPLLWACSKAESVAVAEAVITKLLSVGADANAMDDDGWSCCTNAASNPDPDVAVAALRLLSAHGADVNRPTKDGRTPLMLSMSSPGNQASVLVECGADVHATDMYGLNALHHACLHTSTPADAVSVITTLLTAGADDGDGTKAVIRALVAAGAGCPLQECRVNTFLSGPAAAEALWQAGGRYYMPDPEGGWIGPSRLEGVHNAAARTQDFGELLKQLPSRDADEMMGMMGFMMQAIDAAGLSEEQAFPFLSARDPNGILPFLRANFKQGSGGSSAPAPKQEPGGPSQKGFF
ncbi:water dikinase [Chlorella sorokiniana]|uniref:Water dikinase n=1 Tax=Chlorella sorokiniana TaxID=3076 RepID=A0A2P6TDF7_CHLSO|nr:water dikinase [Chlorella sorokiniana]|eukprot:PRW20680.1 water dikinase [Chlorella sorokiniana]